MPAVASRESQLAALVVYAATAPVRASQVTALVVYPPNEVHLTETGQVAALVVYAGSPFNVPDTSQVAALVVYGTGVGNENRTRAWSFTLDGHVFYVLDLGDTGTFLYDRDTGQWCRFQTDGYNGWNFRIGVMWGDSNRIIGGDTLTDEALELDPDAVTDEVFKLIQHVATGGIMTRSRVFLSTDAVRIAGSIGSLQSSDNVSFTLKFSDDNGKTWSPAFTVVLAPDDFGGEVAWTSLGSFMAPGRVFEFSDFGGLKRVDGADVFLNDFDDDAEKNMQANYGQLGSS